MASKTEAWFRQVNDLDRIVKITHCIQKVTKGFVGDDFDFFHFNAFCITFPMQIDIPGMESSIARTRVIVDMHVMPQDSARSRAFF